MELQDRRLRMNFKPDIKILDDLVISFPMVFESPQSELRFESYGRNKKMKFGSDPPQLATARSQLLQVYSLGDGPFPSEGDPFPIKPSDFPEASRRFEQTSATDLSASEK